MFGLGTHHHSHLNIHPQTPDKCNDKQRQKGTLHEFASKKERGKNEIGVYTCPHSGTGVPVAVAVEVDVPVDPEKEGVGATGVKLGVTTYDPEQTSPS